MRKQLLELVLEMLGCLKSEELITQLRQGIQELNHEDVAAELNRWQTLSNLETAYADGGIEL